MTLRDCRIPIIEIENFQTGSLEKQKRTAQEIRGSLEKFGLFYITRSDLDSEYLNKQFQLSKEFFNLPAEIKRKIPIKSGGFTRGYVPMGFESGSDRLECKEAFSCGYAWPEHIAPSNALQGPNIWPPEGLPNPGWPEAMSALYQNFVGVAENTVVGLSQALYGTPDGLSSYCSSGDTISLMRLFHYFPYSNQTPVDGPPQQEKIGSSPHTDWGFLTLILQDQTGGLQFLNNDEWVDVDCIPETMLVLCGDYLSLLSNGKFKAPVHRVVSSNDQPERYSFTFFYYPSYEAVINPTNILNPTGSASYNTLLDMAHNIDISNVAFGDYLLKKWDGVYKK